MVKEVINSREPSIKKRRKNSSNITETNKQDEDPYQKISEFEEVEAFKRSPEKDAELYFQTSNSIRVLFSEIAKLKRLGTPEALAEISDKRVETTMLIALLKKLNRLEKFRTKSARDALHQEKLQADSTKLQLQNLLYELSYLKKEISKCFQFKSLDEEIELIPEDEFYRDAPASVSREGATRGSAHQLQLARLEWELQQRKQLSSQCQQLEVEKERVAEQIVQKHERLDKLTPQLGGVLDAMRPLQEHLGLAADAPQDHRLAHLLPDPLYLLYAGALAYAQVYDPQTEVRVTGTEDEALQLRDEARAQDAPVTGAAAAADDDDDSTDDSDDDSDSEPGPDRQADAGDEAVADRQKHHHHRKGSRGQQRGERHGRLLAPHPLGVQLTFRLQAGSLVVHFQYRLRLRVVTVRCQVAPARPMAGTAAAEALQPDAVLCELFPGDLGADSPNPCNHYQLVRAGLGPFATLVGQLGHAYLWAQHACGLDFVAARAHAPPPRRLEDVLRAVRRRFRARLGLARQLQELEAGAVPPAPPHFSVPARLAATLGPWRRVTWEDYCAHAATARFVGLVGPSDLLYRVAVTRGAARLDALLAVRSACPRQAGVFALAVHWRGEHTALTSDAVRDMERAVNADWPEPAPGARTYRADSCLLSAQVRRLVACFDVYLEVLAPADFALDKIYFKATRGRTRSLPFKFLKVGGGVFMQY